MFDEKHFGLGLTDCNFSQSHKFTSMIRVHRYTGATTQAANTQAIKHDKMHLVTLTHTP